MKVLVLAAMLLGSAANAQFSSPEQIGNGITVDQSRWVEAQAGLRSGGSGYEQSRTRFLVDHIVAALHGNDCRSAAEFAEKTRAPKVIERVQLACQ